jgi:DNA-binding MarR family transcriptional regulator
VFAKKLTDYGIEIGPGQGRILYALWKNDGIPISELARVTSLGKSTLTELVDRLSEAGLVTRENNPVDRRSVLINLTEKSKGLREKYTKVSEEMFQLFYKGFSEEEISILESYLRRLLENLHQVEIH